MIYLCPFLVCFKKVCIFNNSLIILRQTYVFDNNGYLISHINKISKFINDNYGYASGEVSSSETQISYNIDNFTFDKTGYAEV